MPKGQYERRPRENKRQDILEAAMKVLSYYGVFGATFELIAEEAGVSVSLIVKYYGNKENLVELCLNRFMDSFIVKLRRSAEKKGNTYRQHIEYVFRLYKHSRNEWQFIVATLNTPALAHFCRKLVTEYLYIGREVVECFADEIKPGKVNDLAYAMGAMYFHYILGGNEENYRSARDALLAEFLLPEEKNKQK